MFVEVRYVDGCPNAATAQRRLAAALAETGRGDVSVRLRRIDDERQAVLLGFTGSPTILVDGVDPFQAPAAAALTCRLYPTPDGLAGCPTVDQLIRVLRSSPHI